VPERVLDLASDITRGLPTPYDKAKAIEAYLRTNYPYDLEVPVPPADRDVADYFLFDLKKGYCDYFATSMVVLARASGLPARFVSGYAPGSYDAPNAQYVIRELNAHSWAEVYFPEIGWVEFEPTASLPEIERTEDILSMPLDRGNEQTASDLLARFRLERILLWSSPLLGAMLLAVLYVVFIEPWLVLRLPPEKAIENVYQRFYRVARPIAGAWTRAETSSEFLRKFTSAIRVLRDQTRYRRLTARIDANANALTDLYHSSLFTKCETRKQDAVIAWRTWKHLQRQLFGAKLLSRLMNIDLRSQKIMSDQS
jgi:transglutaminase-like putative cysteine protease